MCRTYVVFTWALAFTDTNSSRVFQIKNFKSIVEIVLFSRWIGSVAGCTFDAIGSYYLTSLPFGMLGIIDGIVAYLP